MNGPYRKPAAAETRPGRLRAAAFGYRARLLALSATAAGAPLLALTATGAPANIVTAATAASLAAFIGAALLLRPLGRVARTLGDCAGPSGEHGLDDGPRSMLANIARIAAYAEALRQSISDQHPLTGLPTRDRFLNLVAASMREAEEPAVLGVIRFEDYEGLAAFDRPAADRALVAFAARLKASADSERLVAHVDGNCFALWFPGAQDVGELQALAYVLSQEMTEGETRLTPKVTLGAALFPRDGGEPSGLLTRALAALADAGPARLGKAAFFSAEAFTAARDRFARGQELRRALRREQFSLLYQPVIDIKQNRVAGAEALLRWNHPVLGAVPPTEFIPIVEQSGLMEEIGLWVLNTACREAREWQDQGFADLTMAVNLSTNQCRDPQLGALVMRTLDRHGLKPQHLELELTETAAMEDGDSTRQLLTQLRDLGISVAIDDFGAGYSSLSYLKNLPFSKLKIDREFVTRVDERRDSQAICSALVALARGLNIRVLAEGVERREELETLRTLGCGLIQGFYFAKPLTSAEFVRTITDPNWLSLIESPVHRQRTLIERRARL